MVSEDRNETELASSDTGFGQRGNERINSAPGRSISLRTTFAERLDCGGLLPFFGQPSAITSKAPASRRTPNASRGR